MNTIEKTKSDKEESFNYTKDHHIAMVLSIECMNEHGWFGRERQMMEIKDYIEKICGYKN